MKIIKLLSYFLLSAIFVFLNQTVFSVFEITSNFNFLLVMIVFITIIWGLNLGIIFSVIIGILMGVYSYLPIGTLLLIYILVVILIDFFYKNVLINFSFFTSLVLIIIATVTYEVLLILSNLLFYFLGLINVYINLNIITAYDFFWQIVLNLIIMSIIFIFAKTVFKKLNLVFLIKR